MTTYQKFMWMIVVALLGFGYRQQIANADVFAKADTLTKTKYFTFIKPIDHAPKGDTFEYRNTANFSGKIMYSPLITGRDNDPGSVTRYIVIRTLSNGKQVSINALPVQTSLNIYGFQFSPDGKTLLFKAGTPFGDPSDPYLISLWNLAKNTVFPGPRNTNDIAFYRVRWSPSGRYIAYCRGANVDGNEYPFPNVYSPLRLYTYDPETGKEHFIAKASSVRYFTWTNSDKLLFSITAAEYAKQQHKKVKPDGRSSLLNIYQSSPSGKDIQLLIKDGFIVYPSPDGTKFIFRSLANIDERQNHKKYESSSGYAYADYQNPMLYDSKSHTFKAIKNVEEGLHHVLWMPNGNAILFAKYVYQCATKGAFRVSKNNLSSMEQKQVAQFEEQDISSFTGSISYDQFAKLALSKDMRYLSVKAASKDNLVTTSGIQYYDNQFESIMVADMQSSSVFTICTLGTCKKQFITLAC